MDTVQENIMLIAHKVTSEVTYLGNRMYMVSPWVMSERKMHDFLDGRISLHHSKKADSYITGLVTDVINLGRIGGKNRVAFVFKRTNNVVRPLRIRSRFANTISETTEQVRY